MDSRRLLIVKKVVSLLSTMSTAKGQVECGEPFAECGNPFAELGGELDTSGYTVVPTTVYLGRTSFTGQEKKPFITVIEAPEQPEEITLSDSDPINYHKINLAIYGYIASDHDDNPTTPAYEFLAEIMRCLRFGQQSKLDGSVIGLTYQPGYTWQDEKTQVTYSAINVTIDFEEYLDNPYQPL